MEETERRIKQAVADGEVIPKLAGGRFWTLTLDEATASAIERRGLSIRPFEQQEEETT